jgi:NAD(P)-dependent dehydrogenase (short-subunit alcohol dehydrogenase family)
MSYTNKTALIIGGSHGIGLATAQLLQSQGAKVLVTGRSPEPIRSAQAQLGPAAKVVPCDITSLGSINTLVETASSFFGTGRTIDLLFINAGYAALEPFTDVSEASFRRTFDTNVFGAFFAAQKLAPLVAPGGAIVFTTSVANQMGIPGMSVYAASKAAVHSFVQTLAAELVGMQVRVNAVSPGFVRTPTMGVVGASKEELAEFEGQGVKSTPMGRIAEPEEVAKAVVFLGFEASFTTGEQVIVDGGLATLRLH